MLNSRFMLMVLFLSIDLIFMGTVTWKLFSTGSFILGSFILIHTIILARIAIQMIRQSLVYMKLHNFQSSIQGPGDTDSGDSNHSPATAHAPYLDYQLRHFPDWSQN